MNVWLESLCFNFCAASGWRASGSARWPNQTFCCPCSYSLSVPVSHGKVLNSGHPIPPAFPKYTHIFSQLSFLYSMRHNRILSAPRLSISIGSFRLSVRWSLNRGQRANLSTRGGCPNILYFPKRYLRA